MTAVLREVILHWKKCPLENIRGTRKIIKCSKPKLTKILYKFGFKSYSQNGLG